MDGGRGGTLAGKAGRGSRGRLCLAALLVLATLAMVPTGPAVADVLPPPPSWTQPRFDAANTAFNSSEIWLSTSNVNSLAQDWEVTGTAGSVPLVAGGVVYVGCEPGVLCALDASNGSVRWKTSGPP